jgi:hypothetical protein
LRHTNGLNLPIGRYPEVIGDRAAAHMSLHLNQQCQRADALPPPVRLVPGIGYADERRRETNADLSKKAASAAVRRHICVGPNAVNRVFCIYVATRLSPARGSLRPPRIVSR